MCHFDAFDIIDIFGISKKQHVVTTIIENRRDICKIDAWQPSGLTFNFDYWHVFPSDCKQEVEPEAMDINEWKDVQGPVCEQPTIIITEIVDLDVDLYTNVPHYVELYAPRQSNHGHSFNFDLKLVIFYGPLLELNWDYAIPLECIPESNFLVVYNPAVQAQYGDECTIRTSDIASPANSNEYDQIALISGDPDGWFVIDIYGVIGEDGYGKTLDNGS